MKLSIITINYNNLAGLRKTMESVLAQTCHDFEYIVIDGASTDGSAEYIQAHAGRLTYWVSEPDGGIYHAMNKGVRAATGDYVLMLNSGDYLVDSNVIARILPELDGTDIIQGNTISDYSDGQYRDRGYGKSDVDFIDVMNGHFLHQASFIRKDLHRQYGYYDDTYRKGADSYFYWKTLGFGNASFRYVNMDVANFDIHGITKDSAWKQIDREEDERWYRENFPIRLQQLYRDVPRKIAVYDMLHKNKFVWVCTMALIAISKLLCPNKLNIKEKIR